MTNADQLLKQLIELPREDYRRLLRRAEEMRREASDKTQEPLEKLDERPLDKDRAAWLARGALMDPSGRTDETFLYLPADSPPDEIRLIHIGDDVEWPFDTPPLPTLLSIHHLDEARGFEFQRPYRISILDLSHHQFDRLLSGEIPLPPDWSSVDWKEPSGAWSWRAFGRQPSPA